MTFRNNSWWSRRTRLEKRLCASTVVLFLTSILTIGILVVLDFRFKIIESLSSNKKTFYIERPLKEFENSKTFANYNENQGLDNVCLTPACVEAAHMLLSHINPNVSPCDDFYEFSCGRWLNSTVIPDNKVSASSAGDITEIMENQLRILVEEPSKPDDPIYFKNIGKMYKSCMNLRELERLGDDPLIEILDQLGRWPVVEGERWQNTNFDWIDTTLKLRELGLPFNMFFKLSVGPDFRNNTKHIITLDEVLPGVGGRKVMLKGLNDSFVSAYYTLLVKSALLLGAQEVDAVNQIMDLLDFQIAIVNLTTPQEEARNLTKFYNKINVQDLQLMAPNTQWLKLFTGVFNQTIYNTDEVLIHNPSYVKQIDSLLKVTDKRLLANHILSDVILDGMPLLNSRWREIYDEYIFTISGRRSEPQRWETCITAASSLFTAFSALYVRKHFKQESKQKVNEMVTYIHREFIQILNNIEWMDSTTRQKAIEKAYAITTHIGYPKQLLNNSEISTIYEHLEEYSEDQYFQNALKMSKWAINYSFKDLRKMRIKGDWRNYAGAAVVNAYYSAIENAIIFPAGILQGLFFNHDRPEYMNFGAIGTVIAHEITHAFDDIGRQFDKDGNNKNWWDPQTDLKFNNKAECLINQYNNYIVPENGMQMNGINTLGENIADNAGIKHAFRAYKAYVRDHKEEKMLPGLQYTPEQLFWLTYGNVWCSRIRPEVYKLIIAQGSHSPARFRVIGTLSNLKEFAESFNCSVDTNMNPKNKCTVW